jgi:hypothetical protein
VYNRSYRFAWERLNSSKIGKINKVVGGFSLLLNIPDFIYNGVNARNLTNTAVSIIGFCGPIGASIALTYTAVDIYSEHIMGLSISDRLNKYVIIERTW